MASTLAGNVENLLGDGTVLGILDSTAGWLVFTFPVTAFVTVFFFLPLAVLLEARGIRSALAYVLVGLAAVSLFVVLFFGPSALPHSLTLLGAPALLAGATWWYAAIHKRPDALELRNNHG
ncbi:MAG: hypothetical protein ABIW58_01085 [Sphingomicrobium sp.]